MKISLITVVYNNVSTISQSIESVLGQDYDNIEYIIVDGQSTDGTLQVIEQYKEKIDVVISEKDHGIYDAMNKGIRASSGEIIGILNADDFYTSSNVISKIADSFSQNHCDAVYADLVYVNRRNTSKIVRYWKAGIQKSFKLGWHPPHPTFFVRKNVYERHGEYNINLRIAADFEMMLRLIEKEQIKLAYLEEVIVHMRTGGTSNKSALNILKAYFQNRKSFLLNQINYPVFYPFIRYFSKIKQYLYHS